MKSISDQAAAHVLDRTDRRILEVLQEDAGLSNQAWRIASDSAPHPACAGCAHWRRLGSSWHGWHCSTASASVWSSRH
jgi:hypothetical protein